MKGLSILKNILVLAILLGLVYFAVSYSGVIKQTAVIKCASTKRADEITHQLNSDFGSQAGVIKKQAMNIMVSDFIAILSRVQKIPKDVAGLGNYIRNQINDYSKSAKK